MRTKLANFPQNNEGKSSFMQNTITFMPFSSLLHPYQSENDVIK